MTFHRTPAEMAADASFALSPVGSSLSRHLLWLTDDDLAAIGAEPPRPPTSRDPDDAGAPERERLQRAEWGTWWSAACTLHRDRRNEAMSDPEWAAEYLRLMAIRKADGPAELVAMNAAWDAWNAENPERGLTKDERRLRSSNSVRRASLVAEHRRLTRRSPESVRIPEVLAELRECDLLNDRLCALEHSRIPVEKAA